MSKTIVNIIDKSNPLPAYLFTKEYYEDGDGLLFISNEEEANCIQLLTRQLEVDELSVKSIIVKRHENNMLYAVLHYSGRHAAALCKCFCR